ncbi:MAG: hypothetical protein WC510_01890 [Candidatus Omnitrophota bacterium]
MSDWQVVLVEPAKLILSQIGQFFVNVLLFVVILLVGWIIAKLIKSIVIKALRAVKLDDLSERIELDDLLAKGGIKYSLSELMGVVCYWLGLLVTFVVAVNAMGLGVAADLLNKVVLYIPNIIAAIFILILGMFVATLLKNIVQTAASNAGLYQAKLLGRVAEIATMFFAVLITLEQLNMSLKTIDLFITIILGSLGLGFALALGMGCKDIVAKFVSDLIENMKTKK